MSGVATVQFRKYMLQKAMGLDTLAFSQVLVGLTRAVPPINAAINQLDEPSTKVGYGDVGRPSIGLGSTHWEMINDTEVANKSRIYFGTAGEYWGAISGWVMMMEAGGFGHVLAVGTLNNPLKVVTGMRPFIEVHNLSFGVFD